MTCLFHVLSGATMAVWYDMSLHIFGTPYARDHPVTIIRRFCIVAINCLLAIYGIYKLILWSDHDFTVIFLLACSRTLIIRSLNIVFQGSV